MKTVFKTIAAIIATYLVVMLGSGLAIRTLLSTSLGDQLREQAQQSLPVELTLSGGDLDLWEWMQFRPSLALYGLRVGNPEGYSDQPLMSADRVLARADLFDLLGGEPNVAAIQIDAPVVRVESGADGRTNINALLEALKNDTTATADDVDEGKPLSISTLLVSDGRITYVSPGDADFMVRNLNLSALGIGSDQAVDLTVELDLFEEQAVSMEFSGRAGPFSAGAAPATGKLAIAAALGEIPPDFRRELLGTMLEEPGSGSSATIDVDIEGDLFGVVTGAGTIAFGDVRLGQDGVAQLPLDGEAELLLTLIDIVANPSFHLIMPDASLAFGQGRWQGGVEAQFDGETLSGKSIGGIDGVDINEMLTAFTDSADVAFGHLTMPRYSVRFAGSNSQQIFDSLTGDGRLELKEGSFAIFDTLQTIERHAQKLISGTTAAEGVTSFVEFVSNLEVRDQRVYASELALQSQTLRMSGDGSFGFDQSLDFDLNSSVTGALAQLLGGVRDDAGVAWVAVPLRVRGNVASPSVKPDLERLIKDEAIRQATGILGTVLGGRSGDEDGEASSEDAQSPPRLPFNLGDLLKRRSE